MEPSQSSNVKANNKIKINFFKKKYELYRITTDSGNVRFNPNLYANGKVCLSILGTWSGPGWTQVQTMLSTLLSIQSLMNSKPYQNEPGFEYERKSGDIKKYNDCILHETLRVAVCGMMENPTCGNCKKTKKHRFKNLLIFQIKMN